MILLKADDTECTELLDAGNFSGVPQPLGAHVEATQQIIPRIHQYKYIRIIGSSEPLFAVVPASKYF
jgi:hypothetical protein